MTGKLSPLIDKCSLTFSLSQAHARSRGPKKKCFGKQASCGDELGGEEDGAVVHFFSWAELLIIFLGSGL